MSKAVQTAIQANFSQLPSSIQTTLQNTSVMLTGKTPSGLGFTGSGVLLYSDSDYAYVITAKHNLYVFNNLNDPPAVWDPTLPTKFQNAITICYDGPMAFGKPPERTASINDIQAVDIPDPQTWTYDVMILKSSDSGLMGFAKIHSLYSLDPADLSVVMNPQIYLQKGDQNFFIQTGYGNVRDKASNRQQTPLPVAQPAGTNTSQTLQYRFTQPKATATTPVFNQYSTNTTQYYQFQNAVQVLADMNDSTAPGDSGGPLFLARYAGGSWGLYLIGVTSGSDMALGPTPCPGPSAVLENNIVTSLDLCYRNNIF